MILFELANMQVLIRKQAKSYNNIGNKLAKHCEKYGDSSLENIWR